MSLIETTAMTVERRGAVPLRFDAFPAERGDNIVLLGPSGCGKTTFLSVLAGLLPPSTGVVTVNGQDLYSMTAAMRDCFRAKMFGFVFQTLHLLPSLSLKDNIALAGDLTGRADQARLDGLLETLGILHMAHRRPDALSQGERQRAAIARAVLTRPSVLIADEPTSALDDANAEIVADLLLGQARDSGAALIVATHDARIAGRFDKIVRLGSETCARSAA